jgi:hypothetical protein
MILNKNTMKESFNLKLFNQLIITSRRGGLSIGYLITYPYAYPMAITQNIDNAPLCIDQLVITQNTNNLIGTQLIFFFKRKNNLPISYEKKNQ